ncbi:hypothetical protein FNT36_24770 [Hymenobacter setariae]|uniref:Uncharacterized protein n=1 Tax=Hymenobacter setariae TaxID=2594794 RepID=A0A558BJP1_9BACT|nr:hypothetical protein [Hymenobacter setariae]TVT36729.1 hypothetical protein FNT36_24770 [Hymenobacter setariae]
MIPTRQNALNTPVFASQLAYLAVERPPADEAEAQRLRQLKQLIQAAPDMADLRDFATPARELMGEGYTIHCGSSHVWLKRDDQTKRLAIIADRYTTRYRDWDAPAPVLENAEPEYHL